MCLTFLSCRVSASTHMVLTVFSCSSLDRRRMPHTYTKWLSPPPLLNCRFSVVSAVFLGNKSSILLTHVYVDGHDMIPKDAVPAVKKYPPLLAGHIACTLRSGGIHGKRRNELGCMHKRSEIGPNGNIMLRLCTRYSLE